MSISVNLGYETLPSHPEVSLRRAGFRSHLSNWNLERCVEPFWVLFFNPAPGAALRCEGKVFELNRNKIILLPPFIQYSTVLQASCPHYFLWFTASGCFSNPARHIIVLDSAPFAERFESAFAPDARRITRLYVLLLEILMSLSEEVFNNPNSPSPDSRIIRLLEQTECSDTFYSNAELAARLHLSETRFNHLFKAELGLSPQRYFRRQRLERALPLLSEGLDIKSVAAQTGFADRYHFSKLFRERYGVPPALWRKRHAAVRTTDSDISDDLVSVGVKKTPRHVD